MSLVSIHWIFPKLWHRKISRITRFPDFVLSLLIDIHLIFGTLLCHNTIPIKFEFGFHPTEFHKVMSHGLRKIVSFLHFCEPSPSLFLFFFTDFAVSDSYYSKFSLVMLELFWLNIHVPPVGDLYCLQYSQNACFHQRFHWHVQLKLSLKIF